MAKIYRFTLVSLLLYSFVSADAQKNSEKYLSSKEVKLLIDSLSNALNRWYVFPDETKLILVEIKNNFKNAAYSKIKDPQELSTQLTNDIRKVHMDKHLRVRFDPEEAQEMITNYPDSLLKIAEKQEMKEFRNKNFDFVKVEIFSENVGYVRFDGFNGHDEALPTINSAFQFVANTRALIIDLRYNGGGWRDAVLTMQNYFFDKRVSLNHGINNKNDTVKFYSDPYKTTFKLNMPVYILTSKWTFSGAEDFTYGLKNAKRAIVVGDTTGGGAHSTDYFNIGQGFIANIPFSRGFNEATKTDWENTGVYPDISIHESGALSKAKSIIYKDMMEKTTDADERNLFRWYIYATENKDLLTKQQFTDSTYYTKEELKQFCGEYYDKKRKMQVAILLKETSLYIHFISTKEPDVRLIAVGNNRFSYNEDIGRALDFVIENDGKVIGITNIRANGINEFNKVK